MVGVRFEPPTSESKDRNLTTRPPFNLTGSPEMLYCLSPLLCLLSAAVLSAVPVSTSPTSSAPTSGGGLEDKRLTMELKVLGSRPAVATLLFSGGFPFNVELKYTRSQ